MEFSYQYAETMRGLAVNSRPYTYNNSYDGNENYSVMLQVNVPPEVSRCEIPVPIISTFATLTRSEIPDSTIVYPLNVVDWRRECAGAETMLKYFNRQSGGRLIKATTPKGEVYYGNNGIILDKDFVPLMLVTGVVNWENPRINITNYTVYFHPRVFTNDEGIINKSLAKKGVAFYLTNNVDEWRLNRGKFTVKLEDPSKFIVKTNKPDLSHCSNKDFNNILKENIDEVLMQILHDYTGNL